MRRAYSVWSVLTAIGAAGCAVVMIGQIFSLKRGGPTDHAFVLAALVLMMALAFYLIWLEYRDTRLLWLAALPVAAAFLIRALCLDYASGDYNSFLAHWVEFFRQNGGFFAISQDIGDYNVVYLYFVAAISYLDVPDLYRYKLFSILFDVLLAWGSLRLTRTLRPERKKDWAPAVVFSIALFLPTVVLNGAYWGQCDSIYGAMVVHALALLLEDRPKSSVVLMAVAFSFKLQAIFVLPLWGVMWLARKVKFWHLWLFPVTYMGTILPALLLGKPLWEILKGYFDQMGEYSSLTLNAPTIFQFVPYGMEVNEKLLSTLGILAAALLVMALLAVGLFMGRKLNRQVFFTMAVVLAIGVPFFLPHMHERYFFLADMLTLCWACANRKRIPICVLAAGSSLACYVVYLRLKYSVIISVGGQRFVMAVEAAMMLAALAMAAIVLVRQIKSCQGKKFDRRMRYETGVLECEWSAGLSEKGVSGVGDGTESGRDLPAGDEDGTGPGPG